MDVIEAGCEGVDWDQLA